MYHLSFSTIFLFFVLSVFPQNIYTQQGSTVSRAAFRATAEQSIKSLKEGYLLVKLTSDRRKIEELERQAAASPSDKKIAKKLTDAKAHRAEFNEKFKEALAENYDFSKVLYFYDYDAKKLLAGDRSGLFLNESLEVDPGIRLDTEDFLVLSEGSAGDSRIDSYIVHDTKLNPLAKPFPYYYRRNDFFKVFFSMFDSKSAKYRDHSKVVRDMNESFHNYYNKVNQGGM